MTLATRKPTGAVPAPNILIAGEEKSGKTYAAFALSASPRVGTTYVIDINEGCADQYSALGPYLVVEHDGTLEGLARVVKEIAAIPVDPAKPDVVIIDSATAIWSMAKDKAEASARARMAKKNQTGEPVIGMDLWNTAKKDFYKIITPLNDWAGITIFTARGRWSAAVDEKGKPISGQRVWTIEAQKDLAFEVDIVLRLTQPRNLEIVGARSLTMQLPASGMLDITGTTLDTLIFEKLGVKTAVERNTVRPDAWVEVGPAKGELLAAVGGDKAAALAVWGDRGSESITRSDLDALLGTIGDAAPVSEVEGGSEYNVFELDDEVVDRTVSPPSFVTDNGWNPETGEKAS